MRRFRAIAIAAAILSIAAPARSADAPLPAALQVLGTVTNAARPVANALVIALNLQDLKSVQTYTTSDGSFTLQSLPGGIYKIIAVKQGFVPAITTIIPTRTSHRVALRLDSEKKAKRSANDAIWELRGSLPPDVLRDVDAILAPQELATYEIPRFKGEMLSLTGVSNQASNPAYAQTALGVQGRIGDSWQVGLRGNLQRFEDPTDDATFGAPVAESSVMSMELRSGGDQSYHLATTSSSWTYADSPGAVQNREADVRAHNFEWRNGPAKVQVRYFQQDNLFGDAAASNLIEVAGTVPVMQTRRNDLGVALRVKQETITGTADILRVADLAANGTVAVVPSLILHYGMDSRIGMHGQEWAPRTGAEWKLTENSSIIGSAMVKVYDRDAQTFVTLPSIVYWSEDGRALPRYTYTVGFVTGKDEANRFTAVATISEVDEALRMIFADAQNQFWDGLEVEAGDVRRDFRVAYRKQFGNVLAVDVATTAGTASHRDATEQRDKHYVTGDLQSTFNPTRTTIAVSYRDVQQPREEGEGDYRSERIHLRMAQSLYLPIDIKLLVGLELARAENSPYLVDALTPEGRSKKYIGGLALNF